LVAPIMSFTAEEAWPLFAPNEYKASEETIFTQVYATLPTFSDADTLVAKWTRLRELRGTVQKDLEALRTAGSIGSSLQAEVQLEANAQDFALLDSLKEDLKFLFITSTVGITKAANPDAELGIKATASTQPKCERCWHYRSDVGRNPEHPHLCGRCEDNLHGTGESRTFA
jgi:isoleucyl-tRNA synthetase